MEAVSLSFQGKKQNFYIYIRRFFVYLLVQKSKKKSLKHC